MIPAQIILSGALLLVLIGLGGCTPKDRVMGNLYEGVQMQNRQASPPNLEAREPTPGYREYLRQRQEVINETSPGVETLHEKQ